MAIQFRRCGLPHGELGTCDLPSNGHTRHRARTEFGEVEWTEMVLMPHDEEPEPSRAFVGTETANARIDQLAARLRAEEDETATPERLRLVMKTLRAQNITVSKENRKLIDQYSAGLRRLLELQRELNTARAQHNKLVEAIDQLVADWRGDWASTTEIVSRLAEIVRRETQQAAAPVEFCGATATYAGDLLCSLPPNHTGFHTDANGSTWASEVYGVPPYLESEPSIVRRINEDEADDEDDGEVLLARQAEEAKDAHQENVSRRLVDLADQLSSASVALAHIRQLVTFGPTKKMKP